MRLGRQSGKNLKGGGFTSHEDGEGKALPEPHPGDVARGESKTNGRRESKPRGVPATGKKRYCGSPYATGKGVPKKSGALKPWTEEEEFSVTKKAD